MPTVKPKSRSRRRDGELRRRVHQFKVANYNRFGGDPNWFGSHRRSLMDLMMEWKIDRAERAEAIKRARAKSKATAGATKAANKPKPSLFQRTLSTLRKVFGGEK